MSTTGYKEEILRKLAEELRCPVCGLLQDFEFELLRHLQYDVTYDESVRRAVATEGGLCDFHYHPHIKQRNEHAEHFKEHIADYRIRSFRFTRQPNC